MAAPARGAAILVDGSEGIIIEGCTSDRPFVEFTGPGDVQIVDSFEANRHISRRRIEQRSHRYAVSTVTSDAHAGISVTAFATERPAREQEEDIQGLAFADSYSRHCGETWMWRQDRGNGFEDGYLEHPGKSDIPVQITQLDADLRGPLGRHGYVTNWSLDNTTVAIRGAIDRKRLTGADAKQNTLLVLTCPVVLGAELTAKLKTLTVDTGGYKAVWVCPVSGGGFPLLPAASP